jgi:hypothetical protein
MKQITNLNLLDTNKLIVDDEDKLFIVLKADKQTEGTHYLKLIQVNKDFTQYSMTLPTACDENFNFQSPKDKEFLFKFWELDITKEEIAEAIVSAINKKSLLNQETK